MTASEKPEFSEALAAGKALGLALPDSRVVHEAYDQAQSESQPWLFNHCVRSWLYGAKLTEIRKLTPDAELVAVAVLLHDLGLSRADNLTRRFEVVGADAARTFALSHGMEERRADTVWDSIALHTTGSIGQFKCVEVACTGSGIGCDYGGAGYDQFSEDDKKVVLSAYPRLQMKRELKECLCGIARNHPDLTRDNFIADFGHKFIPGYTSFSAADFLQNGPFTE